METSSLTFGEPMWLWALILAPAFAVLFIWANRRSTALLTKLVAARLLPSLAGGVSRTRRVLRAVLLLSGLCGVVIALAQPRLGFSFRETKQKGRDVIIAMDVSRSMLATDLNPTRLMRAKLAAQDLLALLGGDRVGIIAFAGTAFVQAPLTLDHGAVLSTIEEMDTTVIPKGGSNIAAAIRLAIDAFGKAEGVTRALVILTDGEELDADGVAAAREAEKSGLRIFTVGVGSETGSVIPIRGETGGMDIVRDARGNPVKSKLDAARLQEIASATGGFYQALGPHVARKIYDDGILPLEAKDFGMMSSRQPIERYQWPLGFAILCLIGAFGMGERRNGRLAGFGKSGTKAVASLLMVLALGPAAFADPIKAYEEGNYQQALDEFTRDSGRLPETRKLQYNAGTAAYKLGKFDDAVTHFTQALLTRDRDLRGDASYNLANALVRRGEAASASDKKIADWKNAIQHYDEALKLDPNDAKAKHNKEIVEKLLKEEEKKKEEQQKKDQQQKDQQQKDQQQKDQQQKDQQQKDQQQKDQQQKDQQQQDQQQKDQQQKDQQQKDQQQKDQQQKDQQQKDQQQKDQQQKDQQQQDQQQKDQQQKDQQQKDQQQKDQQQKDQSSPGQSPTPQPEPSPGEKKEGDVKGAGDEPPPQEESGGAAQAEPEEAKDGEMSEAQARALLKSLQGEEDKVRVMQQSTIQDAIKDW